MSWTGIGRVYPLNQIPETQRAASADGSRIVGWYVSRTREDRFDDETDYDVTIFNAATGAVEAGVGRSYRIHNDTGEQDGAPIRSVRFQGDSNDTVVISYENGEDEVIRIESELAQLRRGAESNPAPDTPEASWKDFCIRELKRRTGRKPQP